MIVSRNLLLYFFNHSTIEEHQITKQKTVKKDIYSKPTIILCDVIQTSENGLMRTAKLVRWVHSHTVLFSLDFSKFGVHPSEDQCPVDVAL